MIDKFHVILWIYYLHIMQGWISPAKPERIIDIPHRIDSEPLKFDVSVFEAVIRKIKPKDLQVFVVSITGVMRSGKSFLLKMMKLYLDYYEWVSIKFHTLTLYRNTFT